MIRFSIAPTLGALATGLLVVTTAASAQTAQPSSGEVRLHGNDQAFINEATKAVSTQRDAARIATSRSTDREVKAFAEKVANDNATIGTELRAAIPHGVAVPKDDPDNAVLASVRNLRGGEFDKTYIEHVALADQQKALSVFQAEIASGRNEQLKDAARKALPTMQEHYAMAQELAKRKHLSEGAQ
jgi:predicted outer membrane protein